MNLRHALIRESIIADSQHLAILSVENEIFLYQLIQSLKSQVSGDEGPFLLTEGVKTVDIPKTTVFLASPLELDHNPRRALTALYKQLNINLAENEIVFRIQSLLDEIGAILREELLDVDGNLEIAEAPDWEAVWKFYGVRFREEHSRVLESIYFFMQTASRFLGTQLFVVMGAMAFLTVEDLETLTRQLAYDQLQAVFLESYLAEAKKCPDIPILFIDNDLCEVK